MDAISLLAHACSDPSLLNSIERRDGASGSSGSSLQIDTDSIINSMNASGSGSGSNPNTPMKSTSRGNWTAEEDELLRAAVQQYGGRNWKKISDQIPDRTDVQCLHRWQKVLRPGLVKGPWTPEVSSFLALQLHSSSSSLSFYFSIYSQEDKNVIDLVAQHGVKSWSYIAKQLQGRLGKQCRERYAL